MGIAAPRLTIAIVGCLLTLPLSCANAASDTAAYPDLSRLQNGTSEPAQIVDGTLIIIPSGKKQSAKEEANRKLVLAWFDDFWNKGNFDHWPQYMAPNFRNHDPAEPPVGAQALVDWLNTKLKESGHAKPTPKPLPVQLFVLADGDLVFAGHTGKLNYDPNVDPAATFAGNMLRVHDGKIVEWWFTGAIATAPPRATAPTSATSGP